MARLGPLGSRVHRAHRGPVLVSIHEGLPWRGDQLSKPPSTSLRNQQNGAPCSRRGGMLKGARQLVSAPLGPRAHRFLAGHFHLIASLDSRWAQNQRFFPVGL